MLSEVPSIPLVDLEPFLDGTNKADVVEQVARACKDIGFFAIKNHGVDSQIISDVWQSSTDFFDLPIEEKLKSMSTNNTDYPYGYEQSENLELAKSGNDNQVDLKETISFGPDNPLSGMAPRRYPSDPPDFKATVANYYAAMEELTMVLLQIVALGLDLTENWFMDKMDHHICALRLLNYPNLVEEPKPGQLRAGAHSDYGALTILKSGGPGLQVKKDVDHEHPWVDVPTFAEDVFIINLGDMMQRWTNDKFVSTLHRVVVPPMDGQDHRRQSIAFFVNINHDTIVETMDTCIDQEHPLKYDPVAAGEYLMSKFLKSMSGKQAQHDDEL